MPSDHASSINGCNGDAHARGREPADRFVGSLNPAIFHPQWLVRHDLITEAEATDSKVTVVSHDLTSIEFGGLQLICMPYRLALSASDPARYEPAQDLGLRLLAILPHTPLTACGINSTAHYRLVSEAYWHQIGHMLAPKKPVWEHLFAKPGMQSIRIKAPREDAYPGEINVTVEPSAKVHPGLFVHANSHLSITGSETSVGGAELAKEFLENEWATACARAKLVAEEIFSSIPIQNG